jgi:smad nuclear-interacting protein 1
MMKAKSDSRNYIRRPNRGIPTKPEKKISAHVKAKTPIKIDLTPSGILTETISNNEGIVNNNSNSKSKYVPPDDAFECTYETCPLYLFKYKESGDKMTKIPIMNKKSYYIIGRDKELADIGISDDEESELLSKEHAVLQYRKTKNDEISCYIMDLNSTNGTYLNREKLPKRRYVELKHDDSFTFGDPMSNTVFMVLNKNLV